MNIFLDQRSANAMDKIVNQQSNFKMTNSRSSHKIFALQKEKREKKRSEILKAPTCSSASHRLSLIFGPKMPIQGTMLMKDKGKLRN